MTEPYEIEKLLWDLRHVPGTVEEARRDLEALMASYGVDAEASRAVADRDFPGLLALGVSPMLLYFGAMELGVSRDDYYASLRQGGAGTLDGAG